MSMIGSIIGDIVGSVFEHRNVSTKKFSFFDDNKEYTDDTILTVATADWILHGGEVGKYYYSYAATHQHPMGEYGQSFLTWVDKSSPTSLAPAYNSCGNGSAMRVGPVGWGSDDLSELMEMAEKTAICTHNHPEGIKGAKAVVMAIYLARKGFDNKYIKTKIEQTFGYDLNATVEELHKTYTQTFGLDIWTCQGSVPQAILCALEAIDFEDAIRNAVYIGGDSDTIACITGSIAEALYTIPKTMYNEAMAYLPDEFRSIVDEFEKTFQIGNFPL